MQRTEVAQPDPSVGVAPAPRPAADWRIATVTAPSHGRLDVTFNDGTRGEVWMDAFLANSQIAGTVFETLRDPAFFQRVHLALGVVSWPNGADLAPESMYDAIRASGRWVIDA
ncbi:MAG: DUF2442 domain-containing protein [Chloroflexota bacterium]